MRLCWYGICGLVELLLLDLGITVTSSVTYGQCLRSWLLKPSISKEDGIRRPARLLRSHPVSQSHRRQIPMVESE